MIHPIKKRKAAVEHSGAVGGGCGFLLAFALAFVLLLRYELFGAFLSLVVAGIIGAVTWALGEVALERRLDRVPGKTWWLWW